MMLISIIYLIQTQDALTNNFDAIKKNVAGIGYDKKSFELLFMVNGSGGNRRVDGPPLARVVYKAKNDRNSIVKGIAESYGNAIIIGDETMRLTSTLLKDISEGNGGIFFQKPTDNAKYLPGLTFRQRAYIAWKFLMEAK